MSACSLLGSFISYEQGHKKCDYLITMRTVGHSYLLQSTSPYQQQGT